MKTGTMIIFLSVVLTVYSLVHFYLFKRLASALPDDTIEKKIAYGLFFFLGSSYIIARILERFWASPVTDCFMVIGSYWMAAMLYFFILVLFFDELRLLNYWFGIFPESIRNNYALVKQITFYASIALVTGTIIWGYINAQTPVIKEMNLSIEKKAGNLKNLRIVMASDIHLGTIISKDEIKEIVEKINSLNPDIILFAGDIVDENLEPVIRFNLGDELTKLKSKYGTYAITGNHEYIGGAEAACQYLSQHGIKMLRDSSVLVDSAFYVVGREDKDKERFTGRKRKELEELTANLDKHLPIILMNHQPFKLDEPSNFGVDLQLCGHTHHGQIFPINLITNAIYEVSWGYKKINKTHNYVSSGLGTWGPPLRIANTPEIMVFNLAFDTK